ncbi:hypothetical protein U1Q18_001134, partial [Sarracenia purpurea var. burkii]
MKAITEEEKLESKVYKNEDGGDGDENEAEVEGDGDSCTEVESSEIGDDPGDGNPEFSETEDGEKLKQNSASSEDDILRWRKQTIKEEDPVPVPIPVENNLSDTSTYLSVSVLPFVLHLGFMAATAFFVMHVQ